MAQNKLHPLAAEHGWCELVRWTELCFLSLPNQSEEDLHEIYDHHRVTKQGNQYFSQADIL